MVPIIERVSHITSFGDKAPHWIARQAIPFEGHRTIVPEHILNTVVTIIRHPEKRTRINKKGKHASADFPPK
jgi:hypothetical protein